MSDDFLSVVSQKKHENQDDLGTPILFPEIPDPPPGFDPEANPIYGATAEHSSKVKRGKSKPTYIPKARVFLVGPEGDAEYDRILAMGIQGQVVLGKKEVTDMKGSYDFKVYLEWMELVPKGKG